MKINIKIHNNYGVNSFKGQDLDVESAKHLMDVAREMIVGERLTSATPLYLQSDLLEDSEIEHGILDTDSNITTPLKSFPAVMQSAKVSTTDAPKPIPVTKKVTSLTVTTPGPVVYSTPKEDEDNALASQLKKAVVAPLVVLSIQERLSEMNKDYFTTGIKYKEYHGEIVPNYRLRYECPKCAAKANHYVPQNVKYVYCHDCNARLLPEQATDKFLEPDEWSNFFIAKKLDTKFMKA